MTKHNVHLYCVVRVKIPDVEADSQVGAIEKCDRELRNTLHTVLSGTYDDLEMEYAEEIVGALVDEVGDEDFVKSGYYYVGQGGPGDWLRHDNDFAGPFEGFAPGPFHRRPEND